MSQKPLPPIVPLVVESLHRGCPQATALVEAIGSRSILCCLSSQGRMLVLHRIRDLESLPSAGCQAASKSSKAGGAAVGTSETRQARSERTNGTESKSKHL